MLSTQNILMMNISHQEANDVGMYGALRPILGIKDQETSFWDKVPNAISFL